MCLFAMAVRSFFKECNCFWLYKVSARFQRKSHFHYGSNKKSIVQKHYVPCINQMGTDKMHQKKIVHIQWKNDRVEYRRRIAESHNCIEKCALCRILYLFNIFAQPANRVKAWQKYWYRSKKGILCMSMKDSRSPPLIALKPQKNIFM